ncbi:DJ-1/PfpI family protein [Plastoroseomonas hellenica]|uniref:DJ-1/PfpI family protein n=1 Tax=Plastoroseomonas hellenica TaxID=2687306 RepID=UPI001BA7C7D0|nr:DJ-1/PfpI family protein [Plastoroseomonas hellenica]MBR0642716.1 DJ-1/PfpI family protein [Plastoroseomonas hellenica]
MSLSDQPVTRVAMLIYPSFTTLDLIGPHQVLASLPNMQIELVAKTREPVVSDRGVSVNPDRSFEDSDRDYDIILVPGSGKTHVQMEDSDTRSFVSAVGSNANYVTSVCTGSLILAAAGLLVGYRATSHWAYRDSLSAFGAIPEEGRIVVDRNRITGGGVTAGVDFAFRLAAILRGEDIAKVVQLVFEYDPHPPFDAGSPERADPATMALATERLAPSRDAMREAVERLARN